MLTVHGRGNLASIPAAFVNLITENMKKIVIIFFLIFVFAGTALAVRPECKKMRNELTELRLEYHDYANGNHDTWSEITFKRLCEILDEIVQLKRHMRDKNCPFVSRKKNLEKALKERDANSAHDPSLDGRPSRIR
jgi:hypothetical protein